MKRFLTLEKGSAPPPKSQTTRGKPKQQRLSQCKKVVKLNASKFVICPEELKALRDTLEDAASSEQQLLHALRHLDSLVLHSSELTSSQVGKSVKRLRRHTCLDVSTLAARLTEKWRDTVLAEMSSE